MRHGGVTVQLSATHVPASRALPPALGAHARITCTMDPLERENSPRRGVECASRRPARTAAPSHAGTSTLQANALPGQSFSMGERAPDAALLRGGRLRRRGVPIPSRRLLFGQRYFLRAFASSAPRLFCLLPIWCRTGRLFSRKLLRVASSAVPAAGEIAMDGTRPAELGARAPHGHKSDPIQHLTHRDGCANDFRIHPGHSAPCDPDREEEPVLDCPHSVCARLSRMNLIL